jgi:DNA-binding CsgD family transcriptional regulator
VALTEQRSAGSILADEHGAQIRYIIKEHTPRRKAMWKRMWWPLRVPVAVGFVAPYRVARFTMRHRRPLAPLIGGAATLGGCVALQAAGGWPAAIGAAAAAAPELAVRLRPVRRGRKDTKRLERLARRALHRRRLTVWGKVYVSAVYAAVFGWLVWSTATGMAMPAPTALGIATALLGGPWWAHLLFDREREEPVGEHIARWMAHVAVSDGAAPGTVLDEVDIEADGNWSADIVCPPNGPITATTLMGSSIRERIAKAYRIPAVSVNVEHVPSKVEHRARLSVFQSNPLQNVRLWEGPEQMEAKTGTAPIGVYMDDQLTNYRFWRPGSGPVHDLIAGTTDAGKSRLVDMLLAYERHSPHIVSWVIDPQRGQSLPVWQDAVDWFADSVDEGLIMLRELHAFMLDRNRRLANLVWVDFKGRERRGVDHFDPVALGLPILSVTIDEAHLLLQNPEAAAILEAVAKMARKCGIKLRLIVQVPTLDQLGNSTTLREMVASGNVIVLRTGGPVAGQVALNGTLPVEPHKIAKEWPDGSTTSGLGFADVPGARASMMRTFLVEDPYHWAVTGETASFSDEDKTSLGEWWQRWREYRELRRRGEDGGDPNPVADAQERAKKGQPATPTAPAAGSGTVQASARARILAYIRVHGTCTNAQIIDALGLNKKTVSSSLTRMQKDGLVIRDERGTWTAATPAPAAHAAA